MTTESEPTSVFSTLIYVPQYKLFSVHHKPVVSDSKGQPKFR